MRKKTAKSVICCNKHAHEDNRGLKTMHAKLVCISEYSPDELASLGKFLLMCATTLRKTKGASFHLHYRHFATTPDDGMIDIQVSHSP